ncbi:ferric reductase-like transmembrane domain-containing protein [Lysinibacillus fusiformis]|uniref:ferredoxin reductase family protein n=1 Tax=Lysinibacillus fusiformis TaxID=28031 RepID=UPI0004692C7C|nr:ferric reductase-like transmembrane domain-containing protein [Lysinibacillus fusiformis]
MKAYRGLLFIILVMASSACLWYFATPLTPIHPLNKLAHIIGGLAITGLFLVFLFSTRMKILERWFYGLKRLNFYHKVLAMFSLGFIIIHGQLQKMVPDEDLPQTSFREWAKELGELAQYGFIILIALAFLAKFLKYEHWRWLHRLLLLPYTLGIYHTYFSSEYDLLQPSALGIFTALTTTIGFMSALYMMTMYQDMFFPYNGSISNIQKLNAHVIELELTLTKKLHYRPGQFLFLKIFQEGIEKAPHPFSISGGDGEKIRVTMKAVGDFTKQVYNEIQVDTPVAIDGPFGHFDFAKGANQQLWIAGGIGITPFIAYLQTKPTKKIDLYYSFHGVDNIVYKDFLLNYAQSNEQFTVTFIDTTQVDRLTFDQLTIPAHTSIYLCGPEKMVKHFKSSASTSHIESEAFKLR